LQFGYRSEGKGDWVVMPPSVAFKGEFFAQIISHQQKVKRNYKKKKLPQINVL
jgi:hypothetical protein